MYVDWEYEKEAMKIIRKMRYSRIRQKYYVDIYGKSFEFEGVKDAVKYFIGEPKNEN